jgi:Fic family protein
MKEEETAFLTRFLIGSDAIEGIYNDAGRVRDQLVGRHPSGHAGALIMLHRAAQQQRWQVSIGLVLMVQEMIVREQPSKGERQLGESEIGRWRTKNVELAHCSAGGTILSRCPIGSDASNVSADMDAWLEAVRELQLRHREYSPKQKIIAIAQLHWRYERIHPFADGNGRSGRALVYYLYRYMDLWPFVFTDHDKQEKYYPCFRESRPQLMVDYFLSRSAATR